jgi:hypothetical protein
MDEATNTQTTQAPSEIVERGRRGRADPARDAARSLIDARHSGARGAATTGGSRRRD